MKISTATNVSPQMIEDSIKLCNKIIPIILAFQRSDYPVSSEETYCYLRQCIILSTPFTEKYLCICDEYITRHLKSNGIHTINDNIQQLKDIYTKFSTIQDATLYFSNQCTYDYSKAIKRLIRHLNKDFHHIVICRHMNPIYKESYINYQSSNLSYFLMEIANQLAIGDPGKNIEDFYCFFKYLVKLNSKYEQEIIDKCDTYAHQYQLEQGDRPLDYLEIYNSIYSKATNINDLIMDFTGVLSIGSPQFISVKKYLKKINKTLTRFHKRMHAKSCKICGYSMPKIKKCPYCENY